MGGYSSFTCQFNAVFYNQGEPRTTQDPNTEIYLVKFGKLQTLTAAKANLDSFKGSFWYLLR
jgi:hypothetical protein